MNQVEKAVKHIPCPRCGSKRGVACVAKSGFSYAGRWFAHQARVQPFSEEWDRGFHRGWAAALRYGQKTAKAALKKVS